MKAPKMIFTSYIYNDIEAIKTTGVDHKTKRTRKTRMESQCATETDKKTNKNLVNHFAHPKSEVR